MERAVCVGGERRLKTRFANVVVFVRLSGRGMELVSQTRFGIEKNSYVCFHFGGTVYRKLSKYTYFKAPVRNWYKK
jgi:hypothetical protein